MSVRALLLLLVWVGLSIAGCTNIVETTAVPVAGAPTPLGCRSALGGYYLPKTLVSISVSKTASGGELDQSKFNPVTVPDRAHYYCLDYLAVPTADDIITVNRTPDGILDIITSDAIDRTPEIANKLIDTTANMIVALRSGSETTVPKTMRLDFDPFDPEDVSSANRALSFYGFCVYVEGYSLLEGADPSRWCNSRSKSSHGSALYEAAQAPPSPQAQFTEVLYRSNQIYRVTVMRRVKTKKGEDAWQVFLTKGMELPNLSPIFGIGVERALFAQRKTTLAFTNGVLGQVKISKGSELLGLASIPLYLAQAVVDIPARVIQLRIDMTDKNAELIDAQNKLIKAWMDYNTTAGISPRSGSESFADTQDAISTGQTRSAKERLRDASTHRQSSMVGACVDGGGTVDQCAELARRGVLR